MASNIKDLAEQLAKAIEALPEAEKIQALNETRLALHQVSPFRGEPVDCVVWVRNERVEANSYNPNQVSGPELELLRHSIAADGYTQPIVSFWRDDESYEVVDGFHRNRVGKECPAITERIRGYLPLVVINQDRTEQKDRIASTIRHNRARGVHGIEPMANIVSKLYLNGWSNIRIQRELGMDHDEVLRLKQFTGLGSLFEHREYSKAWRLDESDGEEEDAPNEEPWDL